MGAIKGPIWGGHILLLPNNQAKMVTYITKFKMKISQKLLSTCRSVTARFSNFLDLFHMSPTCFDPKIPLSMFFQCSYVFECSFPLYHKQKTCVTIFSKVFHSVFILIQYRQHFFVIHNALV